MRISISFTLFIFSVLVFSWNPALAGSGKDVSTSHFTVSPKALMGGKAPVFIHYEINGYVETADKNSPLYQASFRCLGGHSFVKGKFDDDNFFCVYTRPGGDLVFIRGKASGVAGKSGKGTYTYVGGTGKMAGISGGGTFDRVLITRTIKSVIPGYHVNKGAWKTP